jgi:hypothetical protein
MHEYVIEIKEKELQRSKQPLSKRRRETFPQETRRVTRKSDVAHTKSISNAANNQATNWTIGSRRNANSTEGCCRTLSAGQRRLIWTYGHC